LDREEVEPISAAATLRGTYIDAGAVGDKRRSGCANTVHWRSFSRKRVGNPAPIRYFPSRRIHRILAVDPAVFVRVKPLMADPMEIRS
jgi:hypothetical protein